MRRDRLVCTSCDEPVYLEGGYDGYSGNCLCASFAMRPGSSAPATWEKLGDVVSPSGFGVYHPGQFRGRDRIESPTVVCATHTGEDDPEPTVRFAEASLLGFDTKVELTCPAEHGPSGRDRVETFYLDSSHSRLKLRVLGCYCG